MAIWVGFSSPISKEFEAESLSLGAASPIAAGGAFRKAQTGDFHISKRTDDLSPKLFLGCARGTIFDLVTIELYNNKTNALYLTYTLKNAVITSFQTGGGEPPTETLTVDAGTKTWEYFK